MSGMCRGSSLAAAAIAAAISASRVTSGGMKIATIASTASLAASVAIVRV